MSPPATDGESSRTRADTPGRPPEPNRTVVEVVETSAGSPGWDGPHRPPAVAGYEVLGVLGRGGMGVVYRARHLALKREVALKTLLGADHAPGQLTRFQAEAEAVARLEHPNVVRVFEVGEHAGRPFVALELVRGGTLADKFGRVPQPPGEVAGVVEAVAGAVQAAHAAGVVHRDLKPQNVLLTDDGTPKVTDFGIAKRLDDEAGLTVTGQVMGTPSYMAPEQAVGDAAVGPACDIWALGAILYEGLTGRPPFQGATALDTLDQVRRAEPVPPGRLVPGVPRDLEAVCLRCLEKDPRRRFGSAADLAADLGRFRAGRPTLARPVGAAERAAKWVRRRPTLAGLWAAGLVALLAGVGVLVSLRYSGRLETSLRTTEAERDRADTERAEADRQRGLSDAARAEADAERGRAVAAKGEADRQRERAEANERLADRFRYAADMAVALQAWQDNQPVAAREVLERYRRPPPGRDDLRGFEWFHLAQAARGELAAVKAPAGVRGLAVRRRDGRLVCEGSDGRVAVIDPAGAAAAARVRLAGDPPPGVAALLSPDGRRLIRFTRGMPPEGVGYEAWDLTTRGRLAGWRPDPDEGRVAGAAVAPDGSHFAAVLKDRSARVWEVATGRLVFTTPPVPAGTDLADTIHAAVGPGGRHLVLARRDGLAVWDVAAGREVRQAAWNGRCMAAAVAPGGTFVVTGVRAGPTNTPTHTLVYTQLTGQQPPQVLGPAPAAFSGLTVSPDNRRAAAAGDGGLAFVWDVSGSRPPRVYRGHESVAAVAFSPDGGRLYTAGTDGTVRVWDAGREPGLTAPPVQVHAVDPDIRRGVSVRPTYTAPPGVAVYLYDLADGTSHKLADLADPPPAWGPTATDSAFSPDGRRAAVVLAGRVTVVDVADGRAAGPFPARPGPTLFGPDGRLAVSGDGGRYAFRDPATGEQGDDAPWLRPAGPAASAPQPVFRPDGRQVAYVPPGVNEVRVREVGGATDALTLPTRRRPGRLAFRPDGRELAVADADGPLVTLWDLDAGRPVRELRGHTRGGVDALAYSPDGRRLATHGGDGHLRLWDTAVGQTTFVAHAPAGGRSLAFSRDGQRLALIRTGGDLTVWDAAPADDPPAP